MYDKYRLLRIEHSSVTTNNKNRRYTLRIDKMESEKERKRMLNKLHFDAMRT